VVKTANTGPVADDAQSDSEEKSDDDSDSDEDSSDNSDADVSSKDAVHNIGDPVAVLGATKHGGRLYWKVQWKGTDPETNKAWTPTWEPNASFCPSKTKNKSSLLLVAEYKKANLEWAQEHHQECVDEWKSTK